MKNVLIIISVLGFALASNSCKTRNQTENNGMNVSDSVAVTTAAPAQVLDTWQKYNFTERMGKRMYERYCAVCHGKTGEGDGFNAYNLDPGPHSFVDSAYFAALTDVTLAETIARGGRGVNKSVLMPAYGSTLNKNQIGYLVDYIRTFVGKN